MRDLKYVIIQIGVMFPIAIIFNGIINHSAVVTVVFKDYESDVDDTPKVKVLSAGFCALTNNVFDIDFNVNVYGESESIKEEFQFEGYKSRPEDAEIIFKTLTRSNYF